jgi:hypothetical protein
VWGTGKGPAGGRERWMHQGFGGACARPPWGPSRDALDCAGQSDFIWSSRTVRSLVQNYAIDWCRRGCGAGFLRMSECSIQREGFVFFIFCRGRPVKISESCGGKCGWQVAAAGGCFAGSGHAALKQSPPDPVPSAPPRLVSEYFVRRARLGAGPGLHVHVPHNRWRDLWPCWQQLL